MYQREFYASFSHANQVHPKEDLGDISRVSDTLCRKCGERTNV